VSLAETAEQIEMPFGRKQAGAGRRDHALDAWCTWVVAGRYNNNNNKKIIIIIVVVVVVVVTIIIITTTMFMVLSS